MIVLTRAALRRFRKVLRLSVMAGQPRGRPPAIVVQTGAEGTMIGAAQTGIGLSLVVSQEPAEPERIAFPGELLARLEGSNETEVAFEVSAQGNCNVRWQERGVPQMSGFEHPDPKSIQQLSSVPQDLVVMGTKFLVELNDACRTAARLSTRFAIDCVQLRGNGGQMVGTDGQQLLLQGGYSFPFAVDLLVPALPVFGCSEFAGNTDTKMAATQDRLWLQVGDWTIDFPTNADGRFPRAEQVIPEGQKAGRLTLDPGDVAFLTEKWPGLPGRGDENAALTLELRTEVVLRVGTESGAMELVLAASHYAGPEVRVVLRRNLFERILSLGFTCLEVHSPGRPLVARDKDRVFLVVVQPPDRAVLPTAGAVRLLSTTNASRSISRLPQFERSSVMANSTNGAGTNSNHASEPLDPLDPMIEAEAIKASLVDAQNRTGRLIAALRQQRKQRKAVETAMASLQQLRLVP